MKTFAQFIKEAVETLASTEAKNRGLVGNGHGDWYDREGNFVAKTINGKLKFFGQGDTISKDGISGEEIKKQKPQPIPNTKVKEPEPESEQPVVNGIVVVLGRFNPPSKNHLMLLKSGFDNAKRRGFEYRIYPSRIQDGTLNPLDPKTKISFMKSMFSDYSDYIIDSEESKTIFDILISLYNDGYSDVVIVTGQERLGEFQSLVHKADGDQYQFNTIEVVTSGVKDPDSEVENPGSSAMMRTAAALGDYERFSTGLPISISNSQKKNIFNSVVKSMNITEDTELWRISPELDYEGMRRDYKFNNIFQVDSLVENINSGLVGKVIRRGTNYLICVTEDGIMFKSWLKDLKEVYEIGTCEYRAHAQSMTPGQPVVSFTDVEIKPTMKKKINISRKEVSKVK
jgi:hypothetical protein